MSEDVRILPSLEELYPYAVTVKHKGQSVEVGLAVVKALESHTIMNNAHFILELQVDLDKVGLRFRKKRHARWFKEHKKAIRDAALQSN